MRHKGLMTGVGGCLLLLLTVIVYGVQKEDKAPVIGVLMWNDESELSKTSLEYLEWMDEILDGDVQVMKISKENDLMEMIEEFCRNEGDVLINVDSQDFTEIMQTCEQYQVYLLQMWEMSMDTDILEKAMAHQYFLGCMLSDDLGAGAKMAAALKDGGSRNISILTYYLENNMSNAQQRRNWGFREALEPEGPEANLEIYSFDKGIRYLSRLDEKIDGLLLSERIHEYSVQTAKEIIGNENMKFSYFDVNEFTRDDLEEGSLAMVACGQQNVVELAVAYAYAFVENGMCWEEKLDIVCPYLYLDSVEEFDLYQALCVEEPVYSEEMLYQLINSLKDSTDLLVEYAQDYSLEWLEKQKKS